jgi:hypothetical protein
LEASGFRENHSNHVVLRFAQPHIPVALAMAAIRLTRRSSDISDFSEGGTSFADLVFGYLEEDQTSSENSFSSNGYNDADEDEDEDHENPFNVEENKAFWEEQDRILQVNFHIKFWHINKVFFFFKFFFILL